MARPQRHRLLQGYPPLPLMRAVLAKGATVSSSSVEADKARPLIIGVLPHHMCTPRVEGCGFCTFPHEQHLVGKRKQITREVAGDASSAVARPDIAGRTASAIYFGGATANLASTGELGDIFAAIRARVRVDDAEVTLEGVPSLFLSWLGGPLTWLESLSVRHRRVSMGVQTFDREQIRRMGREAFGDESTVKKVVSKAHARGLTASGDFLFNLPHQSLAQMLDDVQRAVGAGLDQICVYNLVLYEGLGTPWSKDPALVAAVPKSNEGAENWLAVRDALLASGFVQTTLTNFERAAVRASDKRFIYEDASFSPETHDALGIGPSAISAVIDVKGLRAVKRVNGKVVGEDHFPRGPSGELVFPLDAEDLRLLCITRWLSKGEVVRAAYRDLFGGDVVEEHREALEACVAEKLVTIDDRAASLTPLGMYYADTVVGVLTARRAALLRAQGAGHSTLDMATAPTRVAVSFMG